MTKHPPNGFLSQWVLDQFPAGYRGYAIDVGASDGASVNTTWALERAHNWTVLSVEANEEFRESLVWERAWVEFCACAAEPKDAADFFVNVGAPESFSALRIANHPLVRTHNDPAKAAPWRKIKVPVRTVDQLLAKWEFPKLDALCVDVEGGELEVLKGCDLARWKPKVVISEAWDTGHEYPYLATFGYKLVARCVHNDIFRLEVA